MNTYCVGTIRIEESETKSWCQIDKGSSMLATDSTVTSVHKTPPAVTIWNMIRVTPTENVNQQFEDHNW